MQTCHRPAERGNPRLRNQTGLWTTNCKRQGGRQKSKPLTSSRPGQQSAGMPVVPEEHWRGPLQLAAAAGSPRVGPATRLAGPAKGRLPATMQMVIISQKVKLWKVPSVQESLTLNNEHVYKPSPAALGHFVLFCVCLLSYCLLQSLQTSCFENRR